MPRFAEGHENLNANVRTRLGVKGLDSIATGSAKCGKVPAAVASTITCTEYGNEAFHLTVLDCVDTPISIADDAGVAQYGGVQVYTMPKGAIVSFGASILGNLTLGTTGTIIDTFTGVNALGSAAAGTGATLTGTEATWLQSVANAQAAAKVAALKSVSAATALTESPGRVVDGTTTAAPVFFNIAIADDASHTAGTGKFTGRITIAWVNVGGA